MLCQCLYTFRIKCISGTLFTIWSLEFEVVSDTNQLNACLLIKFWYFWYFYSTTCDVIELLVIELFFLFVLFSFHNNTVLKVINIRGYLIATFLPLYIYRPFFVGLASSLRPSSVCQASMELRILALQAT